MDSANTGRERENIHKKISWRDISAKPKKSLSRHFTDRPGKAAWGDIGRLEFK